MERVSPQRPTILVLLAHYYPGYKAGGPMHSIAAIVEALGEEFDFRIITSDRDLKDKKPYAGIQPNAWTRLGNASVVYVRWSPIAVLRHVFRTPHDILYLNSFFNRPFSMVPMWLKALGIFPTRRILIAPRGEFSPGALAIKKWRKCAYIVLARRLAVYRQALWHASSEFEALDVKREIGGNIQTRIVRPISLDAESARELASRLSVLVASDLSFPQRAENPTPARPGKKPGELHMVFLSRISRKKNLDGALRLLHGLRGRVRFDIYGPLEDQSYWKECQRLMATLPPSIQVLYHGEVRHENVNSVLSGYHLFFLPTRGENFGHVILEALAAGCPVLLSDQTPWRDLKRKGIGADLPLDQPDSFQAVLQEYIDMGQDEHEDRSMRAKSYGLIHCRDTEVISANRALFQAVLASKA